MSTTMTSTSLATSNLRGSSSRTRNLPARTSRNARASLRQNSLISAAPSAQGAPQPDPHGFYPAITHFTDAITALPRDFRRHTSLLKEVDAKAWAVEENIQRLLTECLHERQTRPLTSAAQTIAGSTSSVAGDVPMGSAAGSVTGVVLDNASQVSHTSVNQEDILRTRRLYAELRQNLMQIIMPLDEKNHVINNANDELSRHIRRQDEIWPHIADEISEETRLGSLRHWALTDLNPPKKVQAAAGRGRDIFVPDNEVAERSERRREAVALAKKQKTAQHLDSDAEIRKVSRKGMGGRKVQELEDAVANSVNLIGNIPGMKVNKARVAATKKGEETTRKGPTTAAAGGTTMSRESSQQDNSKKRKAPPPATTVARKRINAAAGESPKLGNSPLAGSFGKDAYKKSPALSGAVPVNGRGRQHSAQLGEAAARPPSTSRRNGVALAASEMERVTSATGKTVAEVKHTMKESVNTKGEKFLEEDIPDSIDNRIRGGIALERSASKSSQLKKDDATVGRRTASPRLTAAAAVDNRGERNGKGKAKKTSTPTVGTFAEAAGESESAEATSTAENGSEPAPKTKRPVRPRMKDHHGLHDSLSPKGLPTKRAHKHKGSYSLSGSFRTPRDEEPERKPNRTNSRQRKDDPGRTPSSTPKIGGPGTELVDEPDSLEDVPTRPSNSRRASHNPKKENPTPSLDVKPPSRTTAASNALHNAMSPAFNDEPLGSPGPDVPDDADIEAEGEDIEEDDPNEARYCYCNGVSYGEMVACDNENCAREWFHLECTGLRSLPPARSTWYCDECKGMMVK